MQEGKEDRNFPLLLQKVVHIVKMRFTVSQYPVGAGGVLKGSGNLSPPALSRRKKPSQGEK